MQDTDPQPDIQQIAQCGPIRVWSLVVTILGDLCRQPQDNIPGRTLNLLVAQLGINNQALRVALHRLRRDGWIRTERDGRTSNYFLSDKGRQMSLSARDQIYRAEPPLDLPVAMLMAPPQMTALEFTNGLPDDALSLSARVALTPGLDTAPDNCLIVDFSARDVPVWLAETVAPPPLQQEFAALHSAVRIALKKPVPKSLIDKTALRLVILHHWRRLILRQSVLADVVLPPDWSGAQARQTVMLALDRYPRPPLQELHKNGHTAA